MTIRDLVINFLMKGLKRREIANQLDISLSAVNKHFSELAREFQIPCNLNQEVAIAVALFRSGRCPCRLCQGRRAADAGMLKEVHMEQRSSKIATVLDIFRYRPKPRNSRRIQYTTGERR
jgi:hypothetical protein